MRLILLFVFSAFFLGLNAQVTITIDSLTSFGYGDLDDETTNRKDVKAASTIKNESDQDKTFRWSLTVNSKEQPWAVVVCDVNFCYDSTVVTESFDLAAGATGLLDVHVYPSGNLISLDGAVPGMGKATLKVTEIGNGNNTVTGEYVFDIVGSPFTSLTELEISQLQLFPNPTSDFFELKGPKGVKDITIYNLLGSPVQQFVYREGEKYDISAFPKGIYLVTLTDDKSQVLKTVRLQRS